MRQPGVSFLFSNIQSNFYSGGKFQLQSQLSGNSPGSLREQCQVISTGCFPINSCYQICGVLLAVVKNVHVYSPGSASQI